MSAQNPSGTTNSDQLSNPARKRSGTVGMGVAIALAVVLLLIGIGGGYYLGMSMNKSSSGGSSTTTTQITELGSSLLLPLMQKWGPLYYNVSGQSVVLAPAGGGSGAGQSNAELGLVNIGASDGYLANASATNLINVPVAISAQLIYYHLSTVPTSEHLNLNGTVIAMIYSQAITSWNDPLIMAAQNATVQSQLNALANTSAGETIWLTKRSDSSGDTFLFSSLCQMSYASWTYGVSTTALSGLTGTNVLPENGNSGMVTGLQGQANAIGYVGISYESTATGLGWAAVGDNLSLSASGGVNPANYILPTATTISQDANLGLTHLNYAAYQTAVSLILGGSPLGAINLTHGGGGTNPTATSPTPYPIVNLEYTLIKTSPTGNVVTSGALAATVAFLKWAISNGNFAPTGGPSASIQAVNFVPLTPEVIGYDTMELSLVTW